MAQTADAFFSLRPIEAITPPSENDLEWLRCAVEWRQADRVFRSVSECLTSTEWLQLQNWIEKLETSHRDSILSFSEPSLHCVYLISSDIVVFVCWLELVPEPGKRLPVALAFPRGAIRFIK
jgi:hypothetical protein